MDVDGEVPVCVCVGDIVRFMSQATIESACMCVCVLCVCPFVCRPVAILVHKRAQFHSYTKKESVCRACVCVSFRFLRQSVSLFVRRFVGLFLCLRNSELS